MAKSKAYTHKIGHVGSSESEGFATHQVSPAWVLTFVRWSVRDTQRAPGDGKPNPALLATREPLVVENDCVQLSVNYSKSTHTPSMQAVLLETDVNYATAIAPGDFVFVNMLNWQKDARRIALIGRSNSVEPINKVKDGFKGFFKIQSVRKKITVNESGSKRVMVFITGFAFTEFNNSIYYNPYLRTENQGSGKNDLLFLTNLSADYKTLINPGKNPDCQDIIRLLIQSFIGVGVTDRGKTTTSDGLVITSNTHFFIPSQVGQFLGVPDAQAAKDVYNYLFGIQQYSGSSQTTLASGMNPSNLADQPVGGRFYYTKTPCVGQSLLRAEYWNQQKAWDIINQYTNSPLNELFTTLKVGKNGSVMPTVVYRQTPFSSDAVGETPFNVTVETTKFLNLPRWYIDSSLVFSADLGRDEAARINFVQYYATPSSDVGKPDAYISAQTALGNYAYDINDVTRNGLRPMVISTSFQDLTLVKNVMIGKICANIIGDAVMGEHLKLNGTLECVGIVEPISVGDNLEFDGTVYHIEEVNHACMVDANSGTTMFRTTLRLSHGVDVRTAGTGTRYAEMTHTRGYQNRVADYKNQQILPGVSEEQDTTYRKGSPAPTLKDINKKDAPFVQPGQKIIPLKKEDDDE